MNNSRWATKEELINELTKIDKTLKIEKSGIPLTYDDENLYICDKEYSTLVIGGTGSGKTQSTVLPTLKLAISSGENIFLNDQKGEIFAEVSGLLKENKYNIYTINLNDKTKGNNWNPLSLPYDLYKEGYKDEAIDILDDISYYLFPKIDYLSDPFWITSAINYFKGLTLYLFECAKKEEVNILSIYELADTITEKNISNIKNQRSIYNDLNPIVSAPPETKGGIISVFKNALNPITSREQLSNIICNNDINLKDTTSKNAYFIIGDNNKYTNILVPIFMHELTYCKEKYGNKERLNIFIDEFDQMPKINNLNRMINYGRGCGIRFFLNVSGLNEITIKYNSLDNFISLFPLIIYLSSQDEKTLDYISNLCGEIGFNKIITKADLKLLRMFEAIVIMPRISPIKTKLIPNYQIPWPYNYESILENNRHEKEIKIFKEV